MLFSHLQTLNGCTSATAGKEPMWQKVAKNVVQDQDFPADRDREVPFQWSKRDAHYVSW